jgi:hypothetical protein
VDHRSFRDLLLFSIGFAIGQNRDLLRRMLSEHVTDATREQLAKRVVEHLELSGFEIDEGRQVMRRRPPVSLHRTPAESRSTAAASGNVFCARPAAQSAEGTEELGRTTIGL